MHTAHKIVVLDANTFGNTNFFTDFSKLAPTAVFESTTAQQRISHTADATIIITNKVLIDATVIDACKQLSLICITATGTNNVDIDYATKKGIVVKNVAGYSTESVAQHTFAMLLSFLHSIRFYSSYTKSLAYSQQLLFTHVHKPFVELQGKTWGIIGLGAIGTRVAALAKAFGMRVIYTSTSRKNLHANYEHLPLLELLRHADIVSIHAPLNSDTYNLIRKNELACMKPTAVLVNVGRGGIVNEQDLAIALTENTIAGACIDVMEHEPIPANSPLLSETISSKILITPHVAWTSQEAMLTLIRTVYSYVQEHIGG